MAAEQVSLAPMAQATVCTSQGAFSLCSHSMFLKLQLSEVLLLSIFWRFPRNIFPVSQVLLIINCPGLFVPNQKMLTQGLIQKHVAAHPLCPITASEIKRSADLIRNVYPSKTQLHFKAITLEEPEKAQLVPYLEAEHSATRLPRIDRKAFVSYYIRNTVNILKHRSPNMLR